MEHRLPHGRNLLEQLDLEGGGPRTSARLEPVDGVVVGDGDGEAAIENHCHCLPHHLHETYDVVVIYPFQYQYHRLTSHLIRKYSFLECCLYQIQHHAPPRLLPPLPPVPSPVMCTSIPHIWLRNISHFLRFRHRLTCLMFS